MALFNRVTVWVSNQVLTASALNGEFNNILNNAQLSSWIGFSANVGQMQQQTSPGGVGSESLAGSGSDELQRLRFMLAYTLGKTYWYDQTGRNFGIGNLGVATADIAAGAVTTAKIANNAVTAAQIANATITTTQISASAGILGSQITTSPNFVGLAQVSSNAIVTNLAPTGGSSVLQIMRGAVGTTGSIDAGEGYSVTHSSTGIYVITPTFQNFSTIPAITVTPRATDSFAVITAFGTSSFTVRMKTIPVPSTTTNAAVADIGFCFVAIG